MILAPAASWPADTSALLICVTMQTSRSASSAMVTAATTSARPPSHATATVSRISGSWPMRTSAAVVFATPVKGGASLDTLLACYRHRVTCSASWPMRTSAAVVFPTPVHMAV